MAQVEFLSKTQALVTYQPTLQQQAALSDGSVSGKFIVQYDVERFNDAGEILVRISSLDSSKRYDIFTLQSWSLLMLTDIIIYNSKSLSTFFKLNKNK